MLTESNKNNRKIWVMLIVLLLLVAFIVASSLIFLIKAVECEIVSSPNFVLNDEDLAKISKKYKNESFLFFSTSIAKEEIEKEYPYAKVQKIEKEFPNVLVVWLVERYELFAVESNEEFLILDDEHKILRVGDDRTSQNGDNLILVQNYSMENADYLTKIIETMMECQTNLNLLNLCDVFDSIIFENNSCKITFLSEKNYEFSLNDSFKKNLKQIFNDEEKIY